MKLLSVMVVIVGTMFSAFVNAGHSTKVIQLKTPSGYTTTAWLYLPDKNPKDIGIVFIHGKKGSPESSHNESFTSEMVELGYPVLAPMMPWSEERGYQGTRLQGMELVAEAVNTLPVQRVVVAGHSMGGMATLQYGSGEVPPRVAGLLSIAPGHDPNMAGKLRDDTYSAARKSCKLVKEGKGKDVETFQEINGGHRYSINATNEYYCSFFSTDEFPDTREVVRKIKTPTFMLSGDSDRLTEVYSHRSLLRAIPKNEKNKYEKLSGNHIDVVFSHTDEIAKWIDGL